MEIRRPQGVGMGRKPNLWLKDGDKVEVSLEGVGSCVNRVVFDKPSIYIHIVNIHIDLNSIQIFPFRFHWFSK